MNTTLMWIGNAILFFVVLPVVIALLNRLLIPVIRIRRAAESILDGGVHLMNQVAPVPELLAQLQPVIQKRADGFAEANKRVRSAIRDRGWKFEVEPLPKPDLLGLYVLLPSTAS